MCGFSCWTHRDLVFQIGNSPCLLTTRVSVQLPFQWVFDSMFIPCWFTSCSAAIQRSPSMKDLSEKFKLESLAASKYTSLLYSINKGDNSQCLDSKFWYITLGKKYLDVLLLQAQFRICIWWTPYYSKRAREMNCEWQWSDTSDAVGHMTMTTWQICPDYNHTTQSLKKKSLSNIFIIE